ncbi:glycerate kinase [Bacillus sp. BRMEA1]|uniref:glycerate kinase family protein n=1 Tax=Neobacillus endophyticus TaxID=2738405 RepID=UPI0015666B20|nr:glycerate kinase [Neobacillus endophyticus]NRD79200.1 glycerate kinase [Neobacillus endophyticus]
MKFILAPDSFKESMTAKKAALAMEKGIRKVFPDAECVIAPMADGGEGTVDALVDITNGHIIQSEISGPLGQKVLAEFGLLGEGKTAVIEMASASGLALIKPEERNPLLTTTYGTGELIKHALELGVTQILIGIGGSATNDGGVGMLQALGVSFKDSNGNELGHGGGFLHQLHSIDITGLDSRLKTVHIDVACDVSNPLIGKNGASAIFGPQKGADPEMVMKLDQNLSHYAKIIKQQLNHDVAMTPGSGAAGGLGAGLLAFLNAHLKNGIDLILDYTRLEDQMKDADFVFTGEGSIDSQTIFGKTPYGIAMAAKKYSVPVITIAGKIGTGIEPLYEIGMTSIIGISKGITSIKAALEFGEVNLAFAAENVCRLLSLKK